MYFETHAHYDDEKFNDDRDEILSKMQEKGVDYIINPGCDLESSQFSISLAEKYPFIYPAVGYHPEELKKYTGEGFNEILSIAEHKKCVAIGEIGLDYYWDDTHKAEQKELFIRQLKLAADMNKPVIIHDREAHGDCLEVVKGFKGIPGVFHCYSGSPEMAEILLKNGWYLGFDGPITYKNAKKTIEVCKITPWERILIETDSPYLPPMPHRGERNDSTNLQYIVRKIAEIKGESEEKAAEITFDNARRLFKI